MAGLVIYGKFLESAITITIHLEGEEVDCLNPAFNANCPTVFQK